MKDDVIGDFQRRWDFEMGLQKRHHEHHAISAELPTEGRSPSEGSSCAGGGDEICSDELERYENTEAALQGSILEIGGAAAGLMPVDGTRKRKGRS